VARVRLREDPRCYSCLLSPTLAELTTTEEIAIVTVAAQPQDLASLIPWGCEFASGDDAGLVVVQPVLGSEALVEEGEWTPPAVRVLRVHGPDLLEAVLAVVEEVDGKLLLLPKQERRTGSGAELTLARQLYHHVACPAVLLRASSESQVRRRRILVPTAGGPNASAALRWANRMATTRTHRSPPWSPEQSTDSGTPYSSQ
jgi:hypothetical protein